MQEAFAFIHVPILYIWVKHTCYNLSQLDSVKIIVKLVWGQNQIAKSGRVDFLLVVFFSLSATLN